MAQFAKQVITIIRQIPRGNVATYGQVAALAGSPRAAIMVGQILQRSADDLPWQRVINAQGRISIINMAFPAEVQADLLRQEGVTVHEKNRSYWVDLTKYRWQKTPQ